MEDEIKELICETGEMTEKMNTKGAKDFWIEPYTAEETGRSFREVADEMENYLGSSLPGAPGQSRSSRTRPSPRVT